MSEMLTHIAPLFWHHGERPDVILRELEAVHASGIRQIVIEPRPHPDYLGPQWWEDCRFLLEAARERGMRVWFFDDATFPSGWVNGIIPAEHPEVLKRHLGAHQIDVRGPLPGASFDLRPWIGGGLRLHAVVSARRMSDDILDTRTLREISGDVIDNVLYWDVPEDRWRVIVLTDGHPGDEPETADYLNPIAPGAASVHLSTVYQAHFEHFGADFGGLIAGFFQDEPRFGNAPDYEFRLGSGPRDTGWAARQAVLPFSTSLWERLVARWGTEAASRLALLWWDGEPELTARTRFDYMDEATRLYGAFQCELGDWCAAHGVELIGHVVEDNGAHARLGYGAGHYFRAMSGQHMGGIDAVQHIQPGATAGRRKGTFGNYDDEFYHWGLAKLASSAAHIDPRKRGLAMCEAFGAYGWHEGLRLMKHLTDHLAVRGVNVLVPHAFSPKVWDPDCPPHFFNGGLNPQWPHFAIWRKYAETVSAAMDGGVHLADAAVLYHAEAEWVGAAMPFEKPIGVLARAQRDADVIPIDAVVDAQVTPDGGLRIARETYPLLVIPFAERLPPRLAEAIVDRGIRTIVVDALPSGWSGDAPADLLERFRQAVSVVPLAELPQSVDGAVGTSEDQPDLRVLRRIDDVGLSLVFLVNESLHKAVETWLRVPLEEGTPVIEDSLTGGRYRPTVREDGERIAIALRLEPGESRFLRFDTDEAIQEPEVDRLLGELPCDGWSVSVQAPGEGSFHPAGFGTLGVANAPGRLPQFSGTVRYERTVSLRGARRIDLGEVGETAQVWINGHDLGVRIAPPYRFELPTQSEADSRLVVEVTTTLAPAHADNPFDAVVALEPTGLIGPVRLLANDVDRHAEQSGDRWPTHPGCST